jgi:pimeloyl-ACP methyl ester carboxylesterase
LGKFVNVAGLRMHVVDLAARETPAADGMPVVVLHGASGNLEEIRFALGDRLSAHRRVVFVDRPGHGWSERPADAASPARQAELIANLLGELGIERAIIVAHSFAGAVGTALALDHPAQVAGLVLLAPVSHPWSTGIAWYYTAAATRFIGPLFAWTLALPVGTLVTHLTVAAVFKPQTPPRDYVARAGIALVLRPTNFLANALDVAGLLAFITTQVPRYAGITAPTIVIFGDSDTVVSPRIHARQLVSVVPNSKLVLLKGVGHMVHYGAPEQVSAAIEEIVAVVQTRR